MTLRWWMIWVATLGASLGCLKAGFYPGALVLTTACLGLQRALFVIGRQARPGRPLPGRFRDWVVVLSLIEAGVILILTSIVGATSGYIVFVVAAALSAGGIKKLEPAVAIVAPLGSVALLATIWGGWLVGRAMWSDIRPVYRDDGTPPSRGDIEATSSARGPLPESRFDLLFSGHEIDLALAPTSRDGSTPCVSSSPAPAASSAPTSSSASPPTATT